jgi:hypothetical protein
MRGIKAALLLLGCSWLMGIRAQEVEPDRRQEPAAPDLDFLEYLGTFAEEDEEWLAIEEWRKDIAADAEEPKDPKDAKESDTERDDDDESE